jgi:hypothetical protein
LIKKGFGTGFSLVMYGDATIKRSNLNLFNASFHCMNAVPWQYVNLWLLPMPPIAAEKGSHISA